MKKPTDPPDKEAARAAREKRLAEALRANLRRRKGAAHAERPGRATDTPASGAKGASDPGKDQN